MDPIKAVLTFCAALFFALSPMLSGGFSGYDPALFPVPQDNSPAQPAGYAFAIWGLIYVWLLISAGEGLFTARSTDPEWERTRLPLILSLVPGAAWIGVARLSPLWATVLIFWMLVTALWALFASPSKDRWLLQAPLALYAGWLTAAAWVSLALIGAGYGIGPGATGWAFIALAGAFGTAALVQTRLNRAPFYGAATAWGLIAITVANAGGNTAIAMLAAFGAIALATLAWRAR